MANFLLLIDDYLPNSTRVAAKMMHELAIEFIAQGHTVYVVTPSVYSSKVFQLDGVNVWNFKSGDVKASSKLRRAFNESILSFRAWYGLKEKFLKVKFDGIICYSPSIFWGPLISKLKRRFNCRVYLILRDFFPQWAIDSGMLKKGSLIEKYFRFFENLLYRNSSMIGVMSEKNLLLFLSMTQGKFDVEVLRNWASLTINNIEYTANFRKQLGLEGKVIFLYGGNIGYAQDMPVLMRLALGMKDFKDAHFLFVGQGDQVELICSLAKRWELENFTYLPSISQNDFKELLTEVDIGLFSLAADHTTHNFPGKLLGYMVNSIPILGCVNTGNDLKTIVVNNHAGFIFDNGEDDKLLEAASNLANDIDLRKYIGESARNLVQKEFSVKSAAQKITKGLLIN